MQTLPLAIQSASEISANNTEEALQATRGAILLLEQQTSELENKTRVFLMLAVFQWCFFLVSHATIRRMCNHLLFPLSTTRCVLSQV